jgi:uncharacterized membrane protein
LSFRTRWKFYEHIRNSLWIIPAGFSVIAISLGILVPHLDEQHSTTIGISYGPGAAQGILAAIAGGMITFTGFVFSILLLAVQFGSSQFSPRMLRRFLRDPTTKIALGMFMSTFLYALLVLSTLGHAGAKTTRDGIFVPDYSVSLSLILLLLSMMVFLRLMSRTTQGLRVASVLGELGEDGSKMLGKIYPDRESEPEDRVPLPETDSGTETRTVIYDDKPGVLQSVDRKGLVEIAGRDDVVIELLRPVGDLLYPDAPLFRIHGASQSIDDDRLRQSVAVGDERTMAQDPAFLFRLLADVSSKALSPGVNDPTTSIQALDQIELLLRQLGTRRLTPGVRLDGSGKVRLIYPTPSWEDFLSIALDETRYFGAESIQVARRMRALLEGLRKVVPSHRRPAVEAHLAILDSSVEQSFSGTAEIELAATGDRQGIGSPH